MMKVLIIPIQNKVYNFKNNYLHLAKLYITWEIVKINSVKANLLLLAI